MIKIGITGGIGSGKSTVCRVFSLLGVAVYDSDSQARRLMESDREVVRRIETLFGEGVYRDGMLDRKALSGKIFGDSSLREKLNAIVHPAVEADFLRWAERQPGPYVLEEAAILFESGAWRRMDAVVTVTAPDDVRIRRACLRDRCDEAAVRARMAAQIDERERIARADYVIRNDGREPVIARILELHEIFSRL